MIEQRTVDTATCDGCGKIQYSEEHDFIGFTGTVTEYTGGGGGRQAQWYACGKRCIRPAILSRLADADGEQP